MKTNKIVVSLAVLAIMGLAACSNDDITYDDFDYQTVYFANQYPVRTLELGEDLTVDTSLDNQHKVMIKATMGGVYENKKNRTIDFVVDESLCDGLYFKNTTIKVTPLPANYYTLAAQKIVIPSGSIMGGVEVQLNDAFFEDSKSLSNTYVIPLRMTGLQGADSILQGIPIVDNPNRCVDAHWSVKPRDYVLYAIKYVNPWHGSYLRRGVDQITASGTTTTAVRHKQYVENDEVVKLTTNKLKASTLALVTKNNNLDVSYSLTLNFNDDGTCSVSSNNADYEISGAGKFISKGEKKSMGGIDRDALYLDYSVNFKTMSKVYVTKDTLVLRDRAVAPEYFTVDMK